MSRTRIYKGKSLLKLENDYVCIDIETTGLSPYDDKIIEISAIKVSNNEIIDKFTSLVNPKCHIRNFISHLTGITDTMVKDAPTLEEILQPYLDFIGDSIVIGHNVNFDINFIYDNAETILSKPFPNNFVDTMRIAKILIKGQEHYRLKDISNILDVEYENAHRSLSDCFITISCYDKLKELAMLHQELLSNDKKTITYNKIANIKSSAKEFDETHPLYNSVCVFTGKLDKMTRQEAMQIVVNYGGINDNNVTKRTNYLILGNNEYKNLVNEKSNKQKKAEEYQLNGQDIDIISESVFYDMLDEDYTEAKDIVQSACYITDFLPREPLEEYLKSMIVENCTKQNVVTNMVRVNINANSGLSVWLCNAKEYWDMEGKPNQRIFTILHKKSDKNDTYKIVLLNGRLLIKDFVPIPNEAKSKNDIVIFEGDTEALHRYLSDVFSWELKNYYPPYSFGCCSKYNECSDLLKCVHVNLMYAKGCVYRKNLEAGRIFYGKNRNID